jgi:PAS domain S-box-containing protein
MVVDPKDPIAGNSEFWWSSEFKRLLGFTNGQEFPNMLSTWTDRLHPEDKEKTITAFSEHLMDTTSDVPYCAKYRLQRKSGDYVWLKAIGSTLRDKTGMPLRVVGSVEEIGN